MHQYFNEDNGKREDYRGDYSDDDNEYVEPSFSIDKEGRAICESHSEISRIKFLAQSPENIIKYEEMLKCQTCRHYIDDDCYFPKEEIDRIEKDRIANEIHCKLCGAKIDRPLTVIHSLYYKEKFNVEIPVICCSCFASLNDNTYIRNSKRRMFFFATSLVISAYFLISYFLTILMFSFLGILLFLIPFFFWGYISIRDMRNIYYLWKGRKYYKTVFEQNENGISEEDRNQNNNDEDY